MITPELQQALAALNDTPRGPARVRAAEQASLLADEIGDPEGILQARIALVGSRNGVPDDPAEITMIGWLLNQLDTDLPDQEDRWHILWYGKWAMERVINIPEIDLPTARRMLDDVGRRISAEGYSERPVAQQRTRLAQMSGSTDEIDHWLGRWQAAPRDGLADCFACEASQLGEILAAAGDHEQALATWRPVIVGEADCAEQPELVLGEAVDSLIDTGRIEDAIAVHQRGWRLTRDDPAFAVPTARQLMFALRAGYGGEAVQRLLPRLTWRDQLPLATDRMYFCGIAAAVLETGSAIGVTPATIDGEPATTMIDTLRRTADDIAAAFDTRNESTVVSQQLTRATDPTPYEVAVIIPGLIADREAAEEDEQPAESADPVELAVRLRSTVAAGADPNSLLATWERLRDATQADGREQLAARAYLDRQLAQRRADDDPQAAVALMDQARRAAAAAESATETFLIEVATLGLQNPPDPDAVQRAHRGVEEMIASGESATAAKALLPLASLAEPAERSAMFTRAAELFDVAGDHQWALLGRINAVQASGVEVDEADERLRRLADDAEAGGHDFALVQVLSLRAAVAAAVDPTAAVQLYARALTRAESAGVAVALGLRYGYTTALIDTEDWPAARDQAQELITRAARAGDRRIRAYGGWLLAIAEHQLGNATAAAELLESALPLMRELDGSPPGQAMWLLGEVLAELDEAGAESAYLEAAEIATASGAEQAALRARFQAGRQAWQHDAPERAETVLDDVITRSAELDELDTFIGATRIRANAVAERSVPEAVDALLALPARTVELARRTDRADDLDDVLLSADVERHVAELYAQHSQWQPAHEHLDRAEALLGDRYELLLEVRADRGRYLATAGQVDQAADLLAQVLPHLEADRRYPATAALCNALAAADREEDAQRAWQTYLGEQ